MKPRLRSALLALGCGLALFQAFAGPWPLLGWVALAPVLYRMAAETSACWALFTAGLFSLAWLLPGLSFIAAQTAGGWIAATCWNLLFILAALGAFRVLARRGIWSAVVGGSAAWTLIEIARSRCPVFGFPWLLLGHLTADDRSLRQGADLLGVYGLSFLVCAVNAVLAFMLPPCLGPGFRAPAGGARRRRAAAAVVGLLLLSALLYGSARKAQLEPHLTEGPLLGLIQGCEYNKVERSGDELQAQFDRHAELHAQAARADEAGRRPDLICWAETMLPGRWGAGPFQGRMEALVRAHGIPTLFGSDYLHPDDLNLSQLEQRWYNCAFVMEAGGEIRGRYAKRRLVPFGEYVPFRDWMPFLQQIRSVTRDTYTPGDTPSPVVPVAGLKLAFDVCVEDTHPDLARESALGGAQLLVNLTNDAWFQGSFEPDLHFREASFRAIEVRRPLVRVTNSGVSALVDPLGDRHPALAPDQVGVGRLRVLQLGGPSELTWSMVLGEWGGVVVMGFLLLLAWTGDRNI